MPSVSVLYVNDGVVGPHLELLRKICEPHSNTRPHVTVRFFDKLSLTEEHLNTRVSHLDFVEPGLFWPDSRSKNRRHTVFIKCQSDELVHIEHKPHFPTSAFHVTLYDGQSPRFATELLAVLEEFRWHFRVRLPQGTKLTRVELSTDRRNDVSSAPKPELLHLLRGAAPSVDLADLTGLSHKRRIELIRAVCSHLHRSINGLEKLTPQTARLNARDLRLTEDRLESRIHLTPPELALQITRYAVSLLGTASFPIHFGDPAVGGGAFFLSLLKVVPERLIGSAIGIDLSRAQIIAARSRLASYPIDILPGDFLGMDRLPRRNLILANPPYQRHQGVNSNYKSSLRERASIKLGIEVSGRSGLYIYFMILSHDWMLPEAIAAWLIPSEFMQTAYGAAIRTYLTKRVELLRVHQFGHDTPQFENAQVLPSVVVFRNRPPTSDQQIHLTSGGTLQEPMTSDVVTLSDLAARPTWRIPFGANLEHAGTAVRIRDIFRVTRGIATGANDIFILQRSEAAEAGIAPQFLKPILPKARTLPCDIIDADKDGYPKLRPQLCVLDCDLPEEDIQRRFPLLAHYLDTIKASGILRSVLVRNRHPWYRQERRAPAPFLCTYMGRGSGGKPPLRFIWNKSDAIATNTYLMLYPRPELAELIRESPGKQAELFDLLRSAAEGPISEYSRIHAGGLRKIEPGELGSVRLPSAPHWLTELIEPEFALGE